MTGRGNRVHFGDEDNNENDEEESLDLSIGEEEDEEEDEEDEEIEMNADLDGSSEDDDSILDSGGLLRKRKTGELEEPTIAELVDSCKKIINVSTYELASRIDMNESVVMEALSALDKIAETLEELEMDYFSSENCCPMMTPRNLAPIGEAIEYVTSTDWQALLSACLSDESPSLRSNIKVKNTALHFILSILEPLQTNNMQVPFVTIEQVIPFQTLLAYAYGDGFLHDKHGDNTRKSGTTPMLLRKRDPHTEDEVAARVMKWWRDSPAEAKTMRKLATALVGCATVGERGFADYVMEPHAERGMNISFPRMLLGRIKKELIPEYQRKVGGSSSQEAAGKGSKTPNKSGKAKSSSSSAGAHKPNPNASSSSSAQNAKSSSESLQQKEPTQHQQDNNSSVWDTLEHFKTLNAELRSAIRALAMLSSRNTGVIRPILQENGLKVLIQLLHLGYQDILLAFETLILVSNLSVFQKFANEFVGRGGLKILFDLARTTKAPIFLYPCITYCFAALADVVIDKFCQLPFQFLRQLIKFMIKLLQHPQDLTRINAMHVLGEGVKCPMILKLFDSMDGPKLLLDVLGEPDVPLYSSKTEYYVFEIVKTLERYMCAHAAMAVHMVQREIAAQPSLYLESSKSKDSRGQPGHQQHSHRIRSNSIESFSSLGSSASRSNSRLRQLPEDKPMEIDQVAHEHNINFLQMNRDAAMRILTRTKWRPVELFLTYKLSDKVKDPSDERNSITADLSTSAAFSSAEVSAQEVTRQGSIQISTGEENAGAVQVPGIVLLMQIVFESCNMEVIKSLITDTAISALKILRVLTLLPHTYKPVCECTIPSSYSPFQLDRAHDWANGDYVDDESAQGITVVLGAALGSVEHRDANLIVSALHVLCNCCSPVMGEDRAQRPVRKLARHNNALMTLLALLRFNETPRQADLIRYLACLVLHGLANDHHVAQVLETLNIIQALTKIARSEPILVENKRIHKKLKREAIKLIEHISDACKTADSKAIIGDVADATNKRLMRNAIVERTQISFDSRELMALIKDHLADKGFSKSASALDLELKEIFRGGASQPVPNEKKSLWPTVYLKGSSAPRKKIRFIKHQPPLPGDKQVSRDTSSLSHVNLQTKTGENPSVSSQSVAGRDPQDIQSSSPSLTVSSASKEGRPEERSKPTGAKPHKVGMPSEGRLKSMSTPSRKRQAEENVSSALKRRRIGGQNQVHGTPVIPTVDKVQSQLVVASSNNQHSQVCDNTGVSSMGGNCRVLHTSAAPSTNLERIVQDYLREQHRKCLDPVTIVPPFSLLGKQHECLTESNKPTTNQSAGHLTDRLLRREVTGVLHGGYSGRVQDVRLIHSRSKCIRTFKNITRNDDTPEDEEHDPGEFTDHCSAVAFLHHSSDYEDLLLGTGNGDVVLRNTHTCQTFAKWSIHDRAIRSISVTPDGDKVLTCASDAGTAVLSKLPESVVQTYSGGCSSERRYDYTVRRRNRQEDEVVTLWQETNIADVELDRLGRNVVATLLNPEHDGHEHAAVVYDLSTGQEVVKLVDTKISSRYSWHRACFTPHGSSVVLHNGLLWDVRSRKVIHKFDKLSECGRATFKPDGTQVVIDASVWDLRTYKLFSTCNAFEAAVVLFDSNSSVAYSYRPDIGQEIDPKLYSSYSVIDASDYSTITTNELESYIIEGLAMNPSGQRLAMITSRMDEDMGDDGWEPQRTCKLFEIGRLRHVDDSDLNAEDADELTSASDSDSSDDEDDSDEDDDDDDEGGEIILNEEAMFGPDGEMNRWSDYYTIVESDDE